MLQSRKPLSSRRRWLGRLFRAGISLWVFWGLTTFAAASSTNENSAQVELRPIDTSRFRDSAQHWRHIRDTNRVIQTTPDQPAYAPTQVREIAANILLFQRENGGWPKDYDMLAILTPQQQAALRATRHKSDTSFDNHSIHSQVDYLARAFAATGDPAYREGCERGFDFMLAAQYANGGFPQRWPNPTDFHAHITFNDGVMIGILNVLQDASEKQTHFAWLDSTRRERARTAVRSGVECILKCQSRRNGQLTGWCQQHDEETFQPRSARAFELASICPQDTTEIVEFLMRIEAPSDAILQAVDAAVDWLRRTKLSGVRVERVKAEHADFERHSADFDVVVRLDTNAPPIWARHYEIETDRPVFAGRDAVKRYSLAEVERERRTGSAWYGRWPERLIEQEYPRWRAKVRPAGAPRADEK